MLPDRKRPSAEAINVSNRWCCNVLPDRTPGLGHIAQAVSNGVVGEQQRFFDQDMPGSRKNSSRSSLD